MRRRQVRSGPGVRTQGVQELNSSSFFEPILLPPGEAARIDSEKVVAGFEGKLRAALAKVISVRERS